MIVLILCLFSPSITRSDLQVASISLVLCVGKSVSVTRMAINNFTLNRVLIRAGCVLDICVFCVVHF